MKARTQIIVLAILLFVLAAVAYVTLRQPTPAKPSEPVAAAPASPAATAAPSSGTPAVAPGQTAGADKLPAREDLAALQSWLAPTGAPPWDKSASQRGVVLGLAPLPAAAREAARGRTSPAIGSVSADSLKLDGIFSRDGKRAAAFGGDFYHVGDKLKDSNFTVVDITMNSVKLKGDDGREITLGLLK